MSTFSDLSHFRVSTFSAAVLPDNDVHWITKLKDSDRMAFLGTHKTAELRTNFTMQYIKGILFIL